MITQSIMKNTTYYPFKQLEKTLCLLMLLLIGYGAKASISYQDTCVAPLSITENFINSENGTFSWTAIGTQANYEWELRTSGTPGSGTTGLSQFGNTTANWLSVSDLLPATAYSLSIRTICSEGVFSDWITQPFSSKPATDDLAVQIGDGTVSPLSLYGPILYTGPTIRKGSISNMLFTSAEMIDYGIPTGALITGIAFYKLNNSGTGTNPPTRFRMLASNSSTAVPLSPTTTFGSIEASHIEVYNNEYYNLPNTIGWIKFDFEQPFEYTGDMFELATVDYQTPNPNGSNTAHFTSYVSWQYTEGFADYTLGAWPIGEINSAVLLNHHTIMGSNQFRQRPNVKIYYQLPTMGIDDQFKNKISSYPNPVVDVLHFNTDEPIKGLEVFDSLGRSILKTENSNPNLSVLTSGVYYVKATFKNGKSTTSRILKK